MFKKFFLLMSIAMIFASSSFAKPTYKTHCDCINREAYCQRKGVARVVNFIKGDEELASCGGKEEMTKVCTEKCDKIAAENKDKKWKQNGNIECGDCKTESTFQCRSRWFSHQIEFERCGGKENTVKICKNFCAELEAEDKEIEDKRAAKKAAKDQKKAAKELGKILGISPNAIQKQEQDKGVKDAAPQHEIEHAAPAKGGAKGIK